MTAARGFGVAAGLDPAVGTPLAQRCEALGYPSIWSNDVPGAAGLDTVAVFGEAAPQVALGVTLALDRHDPDDLRRKIESLGLDRERLWLGIGSGHDRRPLRTMRRARPVLREQLAGIRLVLAAMGPRMCELGGAEFDGVFLNWMTPEFAARAREHVEEGARQAGRAAPPVLGYVRTAVGTDAAKRLAKEEGFYRDLHFGYRNHFARLEEPVGTVGIAATDRDEAQRRLAAYDGVLDVIVVRALASATVEAMTALAAAAAPDQ
jgi:alkanesulfonate monooxygenase SsuD/methylene tetrahydromethanopterin reductase-like flavin-dependent oxidoreductase (luciferase family)